MSDITNIQNRNLGDLLRIFGSKQATDALKEMAKVKASTWTDIKDTVSDLSTLSTGGGTGAIISSFRDTVELTIAQQFSPLSNEVNQLITDWITTNITPILNTIISDLTNLVSDNSAGGLIGGIVGSVASIFLPGGPILVAIGSIIGAGIEAGIKEVREDVSNTRNAIVLQFIEDAKRDVQAKVDAQEFRNNFERNRRLGGETLTAIKNVERIINENFVEEQEERRQIIEEQRIQRRLGTQAVF